MLIHFRTRPRHSRGPVVLGQEGRLCAQALGSQPKGQGLQVPPHSHRISYSPPRSLLQDEATNPPDIQVRQRNCQHPHRIDGRQYDGVLEIMMVRLWTSGGLDSKKYGVFLYLAFTQCNAMLCCTIFPCLWPGFAIMGESKPIYIT